MDAITNFGLPPWAQITAGLLLLAIFVSPLTHSNYTKHGAMCIQKPRFLIWVQWKKSPRLAIDQYVAQGYRKVIKSLGKPFVVNMCGAETTVVPPRYLSFLKVEDREELSLCANFENVSFIALLRYPSLIVYTEMFNMSVTSGKKGRHDHVEIDVVARYLNPRLSIFFQHIVPQADFAFDYLDPQGTTFKEINTFEFASSLVYRLSARYMVGLELSRNHDYIHSVIEYSKSFLMSGFMWPIRLFGSFKDWIYWLGTWGLRRDIKRAFSHILPGIDSRL
ncbi:hypothetical protein MMC18_009595 [Xylographa bjoerkii]|nr:hypothetical protein [Xylographa bjoerkii]